MHADSQDGWPCSSETLLEAILGSMHLSAVALYDPEGNILHFQGDQVEKRYGASLEKLRGKNLRDFYPPEVAEARIASIQKVARTNKPVRESFAVELSTGEIHLEITTVPCGNCDGKQLLSFVRDITEQVQAKAALSAREGTERDFRSKLQELHEIVIELAKAESVDEMCRMTVEYGHERLGFDGMSIFFFSEDDPLVFHGTYAIDHNGKVIDYSHGDHRIEEGGPSHRVLQGIDPYWLVKDDRTSPNKKVWPVADGYMRAGAAMWDAGKTFGMVTINNWNTLEPITQHQAELVRLLAAQLGHLIVRKRTEEKVHNKNIALRELLETTGDKAAEVGRQIQANIQSNIVPLLHDIEMNIDPKHKQYVDALAKALDDIASPFSVRLADQCHTLSTTEMKIARLIASGMHTKDIARHQHVEPGTVNKQRESIRRKLGLVGTKVSLTTYLESLLRDRPAED